jgi:hypothetical protein
LKRSRWRCSSSRGSSPFESRPLSNAFSHYPVVKGIKALGAAIMASPSVPGELGQAFRDSGGFPIIVIAAAVGLVFGAVRYHGWDFRLFRRIRITNRTGENLVWAETLTKASKESYAVVGCKDGSRFIGSLLPIVGEGVLLTRENPIIRVELWNPGPSVSVAPPGGANV